MIPSPSARGPLRDHSESKYSGMILRSSARELFRVQVLRSPAQKLRVSSERQKIISKMSKNPLNEAAFVSAGRGRAPSGPEPSPARFGLVRVCVCGECGPLPNNHNNMLRKSWYIYHSNFFCLSNVGLNIKGK